MRLKVLDQIHISAVDADALRPGRIISVSPEIGEELLKAHPAKFEKLPASQEDHKHEPPAPPADGEKAEPAHANKADTRRKTKTA